MAAVTAVGPHAGWTLVLYPSDIVSQPFNDSFADDTLICSSVGPRSCSIVDLRLYWSCHGGLQSPVGVVGEF